MSLVETIQLTQQETAIAEIRAILLDMQTQSESDLRDPVVSSEYGIARIRALLEAVPEMQAMTRLEAQRTMRTLIVMIESSSIPHCLYDTFWEAVRKIFLDRKKR